MMKPEPAETGSKPAPGALALVQAFINTYDLEKKRDSLATPEGLREWLLKHELLKEDARVIDEDVAEITTMRETLRELLQANNNLPLNMEAVDTLNRIAKEAPLTVQFYEDNEEGKARLEPVAKTVKAALAQLLGIVYTAMAESHWSRLKACRNEACHWVFYDHSKNRSGAWCTMAVCGSRMKVRSYRQRQRAAGG